MSRRKLLLGFIFALVLSFGANAVLAATRTVTLRVRGMTCSGCATSVEKALKSTEGVQDARVSFERGKAVIKYDDQKVTVDKLRMVIQSTGFFCDADEKR